MERVAHPLYPNKPIFRRLFSPVDTQRYASLHGHVFIHDCIRAYVVPFGKRGFWRSTSFSCVGSTEFIECCVGVYYEHELSGILYGASDELLVLCGVDDVVDWTWEEFRPKVSWGKDCFFGTWNNDLHKTA